MTKTQDLMYTIVQYTGVCYLWVYRPLAIKRAQVHNFFFFEILCLGRIFSPFYSLRTCVLLIHSSSCGCEFIPLFGISPK